MCSLGIKTIEKPNMTPASEYKTQVRFKIPEKDVSQVYYYQFELS